MARFHLSLSDDEFFRLTPRQLHTLLARHRERAEHEEYLAALIASTVANFSMGAPKKALRPSDFMPSREPIIKRAPTARKGIATNVRCFLAGRMTAQETDFTK